MQTKREGHLIRFGSAVAWLSVTTGLMAQGTMPSTLAPASSSAHQIFDLSFCYRNHSRHLSRG
jgi:hypothetical protein